MLSKSRGLADGFVNVDDCNQRGGEARGRVTLGWAVVTQFTVVMKAGAIGFARLGGDQPAE